MLFRSPTVNYLGTSHVAQIFKALQVAYRAHRGQMRKSGEPFIIHVSRRGFYFFVPCRHLLTQLILHYRSNCLEAFGSCIVAVRP